MNDIRLQIPECPLEYEVPSIPGTHTALVIEVNAADIDWQEKMLPWTLASLINNTDLVMQGVHLYIVCEDGTETRIKTALKRFDLPPNWIIKIGIGYERSYDTILVLNINHWAFRGDSSKGHAEIKLPLTDILRDKKELAVVDYKIDRQSEPCLCNMENCTLEEYRHAIKQLMGAQLAMKI